MKTTVEALQDYYVEKGGELSDVENITTIPDMIDAIATLPGGGGSEQGTPLTSDEINDIVNTIS